MFVCFSYPLKFLFVFSYPLNIHLTQVTGVNLDLACITIFVVCVFYTTAGERLPILFNSDCLMNLNHSWTLELTPPPVSVSAISSTVNSVQFSLTNLNHYEPFERTPTPLKLLRRDEGRGVDRCLPAGSRHHHLHHQHHHHHHPFISSVRRSISGVRSIP